jgi:hypothetical protein
MWISRADYEAILQQRLRVVTDSMQLLATNSELVAILRSELAASQLREKELVAQILELKREGFNPAPGATSEGPRTHIELPTEVEDALIERAGDDPALFTRLQHKYAHELATDNSNAREIAERIRKGGNLNPFDM